MNDPETKTQITAEDIRNGLRSGVVRLITDPNLGCGTVCGIGENWFYFGGLTAEEMTPEEYLRDIPEDDIVREIVETLDDFKCLPDVFEDEYNYYLAILTENANA